MNCAETREGLVGWQDGELSPGDTVRISEHLGLCPACRELEGCLRAATPMAGPGLPAALRRAAFAKIDKAIDEAWGQPAPYATPLSWSERLAERYPLPAGALAGYALALVLAIGWGASNWWAAHDLRAQLDATRAPIARITDVPAGQYRPAAWSPPNDAPPTRETAPAP